MDIKEQDILDWAMNYASYDELERTSKALYSIYAQERKNNHQEKQTANKQTKKQFKKVKEHNYWRYKKGLPKEEFPNMNGAVFTKKI